MVQKELRKESVGMGIKKKHFQNNKAFRQAGGIQCYIMCIFWIGNWMILRVWQKVGGERTTARGGANKKWVMLAGEKRETAERFLRCVFGSDHTFILPEVRWYLWAKKGSFALSPPHTGSLSLSPSPLLLSAPAKFFLSWEVMWVFPHVVDQCY